MVSDDVGENEQKPLAYLVGYENLQRPNIGEETHLHQVTHS